MRERVQKILAQRGVTSRRGAEQLILAGRVTCNGRVCVLGDRADPEEDRILLDGKPLPVQAAPVYIMLNKPRGYVTTLSDEKGRKTAAQLVAGCGVRVYPVGRLDLDSEGLLLFTNDGDLAQRLLHPRFRVDKTYTVWVRGFTPQGLARLGEPMLLEGHPVQGAEVRLGKRQGEAVCLSMTIHEGRNRQIRRMCAQAGMEVTRLQRVREGPLALGTLRTGDWRYLTPGEVAALQALGK